MIQPSTIPLQLESFADMLAFFEESSAQDVEFAEKLKRARECIQGLVALWHENERATQPSYERYKNARTLFLEAASLLLLILGEESTAADDPIKRLRAIMDAYLTELSEAPEDNLYHQN
ncbi:MAG: hypothetical protein J0L97_03320 [Alphaproteobacteria bacterium]|nr:hypothetical protein [Alphaproteobacteria bacterium]